MEKLATNSKIIMSKAQAYRSGFKEALERSPPLMQGAQDDHWVPPQAGFIKVNFDGATFVNPSTTGSDCLGRGQLGQCVVWRQFHRLFGASPEVVEALAALDAVQLAIRKGWSSLEGEGAPPLQVDVAVLADLRMDAQDESFDLLRRIPCKGGKQFDRECLKSFHPDCVEKDDSFLESEDHWTCAWHICSVCRKSSQLHCYTCTKAVCRHCLPKTDFLQVKGEYGFCDLCLKLALLIEENKDYDSDGDKVDFTDRETCEGLFMEYYMIIKKDEGFESRDIYAAQDRVKKKKKNHKSGSDSEEFDDEEDEEQISDYDDVKYEKKHKRKHKEKRSERRKSKAPKKSNQMEFVGWASKSLMEFLASIGKNNSEKLSQDEVTSIINEYAKENKLFHPQKKKMIICDALLKPLFKRKTINKIRVYGLLDDHFTENQDESEEDEVEYNSENDDTSIPSACKRQKKVDVEKKPEKVENDVDQCCFAAIVDENMKLVYLKRSVLYELLKQPESFEEKVVGCYVRAKSDPYDYCSKSSYQLMQVEGVKAVSVGENNAETVLLFSTMPKEIGISRLSDSDFSKEECEVLRQKVLAGQLERPTVGELQEKAKILHKDITKHYWDRQKTLQSPSEQSKLLENVPKVIPDISELDSNTGDVKEDMKSDEGSPTSILHCDNADQGTSEEKAHHGKASTPEPEHEDIPCKKVLEDYENANDGKVNSLLSNEKLDNDLDSETWFVLGPHGENSKCSLSVLKRWNEKSPYASKFKVWKEDQKEEDAVSLLDAINIAFPKQ
ncbi:hypothetical protein BUALT_Bualt15G0094800 [Buddleja alternifolia]|uniref:Uncharacterized protein n=1 Tax=Buddleja alternifolia TaxID=168488 RepID=A0AAV6WKK6_9LAMI|nr:hypothetical protein BUALT_Bualt15G0094800 [Buddleja alternifolia]